MVVETIGITAGILLGSLSLLYTWYSNKVLGPKFLMIRPIISAGGTPGKDFHFRITPIIMNIGDQRGYWKITDLVLAMKDYYFFGEGPLRDKFSGVMGPGEMYPKAFVFKEPALTKNKKLLSEGFPLVRARGFIINHDGNEKPYEQTLEVEFEKSTIEEYTKFWHTKGGGTPQVGFEERE